MDKNIAARMEADRLEREALNQRLREQYAPNLPEKITALIFKKAWEDGHPYGNYAVETEYDEIATIAYAAWNEALGTNAYGGD